MSDVPVYLGREAIQGGGQELRAMVTGRPMFASVEVALQNSEVVADASTLLWMPGEGVEIETDCFGGACVGFMRSCAGEGCCQNKYKGSGIIGLSFKLPGDIMGFRVGPRDGYILSKGAFVCGTSNLQVSARFAGCPACLVSGEGPFMTKVTSADGQTSGMFFAGGFGSITRHDIPLGRTMLVDNGLFFLLLITCSNYL